MFNAASNGVYIFTQQQINSLHKVQKLWKKKTETHYEVGLQYYEIIIAD